MNTILVSFHVIFVFVSQTQEEEEEKRRGMRGGFLVKISSRQSAKAVFDASSKTESFVNRVISLTISTGECIRAGIVFLQVLCD